MMIKNIFTVLSFLFIVTGCATNNYIEDKKTFSNEKEMLQFLKNFSELNSFDIAEDFFNSTIFLFNIENSKIYLLKQSNISGHFNEDIYFSHITNHDYVRNIKLTKYDKTKEVFEKEIDTFSSGSYLTLNIQNTFDNKKIVELNFFESEIIKFNNETPTLVIKEVENNQEIVKTYSLTDFNLPVARVVDISKDFIINNNEPFLVYKDDSIIIYMIVSY